MGTGKVSEMRGKLMIVAALGLVLTLAMSGVSRSACAADGPYKPTWESLRQYKEIPEWLREGKFGIYTHWGPYAVHAQYKVDYPVHFILVVPAKYSVHTEFEVRVLVKKALEDNVGHMRYFVV